MVATAERFRALVREVVPDAVETARAGWHSINYATPEAGYFCGVFPREEFVRLVFERGASLPDRDGVLEGTGSQVRHVEARSPDAIPADAVRRLLALASTA